MNLKQFFSGHQTNTNDCEECGATCQERSIGVVYQESITACKINVKLALILIERLRWPLFNFWSLSKTNAVAWVWQVWFESEISDTHWLNLNSTVTMQSKFGIILRI
eukprot:TRINITY_DN37692_c0_g1_i4.p1 TRINITY_DN37692_c0_g1~~TRINITY_DN37692_c0_g1_i4.p1  ORF type:complete len:107 (+),score=4.57 TRINITY_DN37692_c0_g1_i4:348-668(+)